jgi:hypothetical protein
VNVLRRRARIALQRAASANFTVWDAACSTAHEDPKRHATTDRIQSRHHARRLRDRVRSTITPGAQPHNMSAAQHAAMADNEAKASHLRRSA